ncbi:hypothetical protein L226DRAFT_37398 [Lentinus tigrinus ALCF2SS1-7]|uniref:Uncharacterized protein n=1 Tax=Lentinus tigrinus ALCF2SS1-6 TaxID=1328759 RepID=A0A5C2SLP1_9APHY|nr:hypothetical protein L227DRAFT_607343 [Lentinus tigrinus ALCF2SS1-6]RPD82796.1 hypothetical protein L226DRAFT_37398 [Lentinus tigrinus ALCF2SS1-7]
MRAVSARLAQLLLLWVLLRTTRVAGVLVNRTIDDELGDVTTGFIPTYSPLDKWARGDECTGCDIHPGLVNVTQAFDQTWHDSTYHPGDPDHTIIFGFNGTALYVYHLLANTLNSGQTTTFTNLTFFMDGQYAGQFIHESDNTSDILYNVLVFNQTNLSHQRHSFKSVTNGPTAALILFDYAIYTTDNDTTTSSSSSVSSDHTSTTSGTSTLTPLAQTSLASTSKTPVGAIVGGTVGGVVALAGVGALIVCLRRRRTIRPPSIAERVEPFTIDGGEHSFTDLPSRRMSHPPRLPDLRLGRSRLMPGPGSSTTGSSSAGSTRHFFTPHRPRLPPLPPQSVSGRTDRSRANTELVQRIQTLEAQMRSLETRQQSGSSGSNRGSRSNPSSNSNSNSSGSRGRSANRSAPSSGLRSELANLRNEIAELRAELEHDQQLLAEVDAPPPSYNR